MVIDSPGPVSSPTPGHLLLPVTAVSVDSGAHWMEHFPSSFPYTSPLITAPFSDREWGVNEHSTSRATKVSSCVLPCRVLYWNP
jgi:hypothetical protein